MQSVSRLNTAMLVSAIVASLATLVVFVWAGEQEPFYGAFDVVDALLMLVAAGSLVGFWFIWSASTVCAVRRKWWTPATLFLLLIAVLFGYINYSVCSGT